MPIVKEERYFGPGLPHGGTTSAHEAYKVGLTFARTNAIMEYRGGMWHPGDIAQNWPDLERVIAEADEKFDAECSTELLAAVLIQPYLDREHNDEIDPRPGATPAPPDPDFAEVEEPPALEPDERVVTASPSVCICTMEELRSGGKPNIDCPIHGIAF